MAPESEQQSIDSVKLNQQQSDQKTVTLIKRVNERTLLAGNVGVSIQVKHNLALRSEFSTRINLTLKDSQIIESEIKSKTNSPQIEDKSDERIPLNERDITHISSDEVVRKKYQSIQMILENDFDQGIP